MPRQINSTPHTILPGSVNVDPEEEEGGQGAGDLGFALRSSQRAYGEEYWSGSGSMSGGAAGGRSTTNVYSGGNAIKTKSTTSGLSADLNPSKISRPSNNEFKAGAPGWSPISTPKPLRTPMEPKPLTTGTKTSAPIPPEPAPQLSPTKLPNLNKKPLTVNPNPLEPTPEPSLPPEPAPTPSVKPKEVAEPDPVKTKTDTSTDTSEEPNKDKNKNKNRFSLPTLSTDALTISQESNTIGRATNFSQGMRG